MDLTYLQRHLRRISLLLPGLILLVGLFLLNSVPAQAEESHSLVSSSSGASANAVTILILDMSGSMQTNDPQGYRCSAADAFIDMSGPGNFIGVVGLDGDGTRGGAHNFARTLWTINPVDMSALNDRNNLKATIQQKSHNCAPDGVTPTYDALNTALQMLKAQEANGSVILLTDGEPDDGGASADVASQINATTSELLPQFRQHSWPIDTIALGQNAPLDEGGTQFATFHDFLQGVATATHGEFYDDGHGDVPGVNPLNIAQFFANIFALRNERTVKRDIGATPLTGSLVKRNFDVAQFTDHLDIIAVKDQASTQITLLNPGGQLVTPQSGIARYTNAYYVIYSIDQPPQGTWELDVQGSTGQFLMYSLKKTTLNLSPLVIAQSGLVSTGQKQSFATGQLLTITVSLLDQGVTVNDLSTYTLTGTVSYKGANPYSQNFALQGAPSGIYTGKFTVPDSEPTGGYDIIITVSEGSLANILTSSTLQVDIGKFPLPLLLAANAQPTALPVTTRVISWDPALSLLYSLPLPGFLSALALQGHPVGQALMQGQVDFNDQPYVGATVSATVTQAGNSNPEQATVQSENQGQFSLAFPANATTTYTVHFTTYGTSNDTHGDFGSTNNLVVLTVIPSSPLQEIGAWLLTLLYIWCLILLLNLVRFFALAHPFGGLVQSQDGTITGQIAFNRARRGPFAYFRPNIVSSNQVHLPNGLIFRFKRGGGIEVRSAGHTGRHWQTGEGGELRQQFQEVRELRFAPPGSDIEEDGLTAATYIVKSKLNANASGSGSEDDGYFADPRTRSRGKKSSGRSASRSRSSKKRVSDDDDYYNDRYDDY